MKFTSEIWHTHSAGLPESFKPILVLSPAKVHIISDPQLRAFLDIS